MLKEAEDKDSRLDKKLVLIPPSKREAMLREDIATGSLFVAVGQENKILAYKKAITPDQVALAEILGNELCVCTKPPEQTVLLEHPAGTLRSVRTYSKAPYAIDPEIIYLYSGRDLTSEEERGKGHNRKLSLAALNIICPPPHPKRYALCFGLSDTNADFTELSRGRARGIIRTFSQFLGDIRNKDWRKIVLLGTRAPAFKPELSLDENDNIVCTATVPGFGYLLIEQQDSAESSS